MKRKYGLAFLFALVCLLCGAIFCACDPMGNGDQTNNGEQTNSGEHRHVFLGDEYVTEPDCTHGGIWRMKCACGEEKFRELSPLGHVFQSSEITKPSTCTEDGIRTYYCGRCDATKEETIAARHQYISVAKAPTCTETGYTMHLYCTQCGERGEGYELLPALGHTPYISTDPTCTQWGYSFSCARCHQPMNTDIPPLGHDFGAWEPLREPDCLNVGLEQRTCTRCNATDEQISSAMLSHEYLNGRCVTCGRKDWAHAEIDDPDLYGGEYAFLGLADFEFGAQMQKLYREIEADAREFHVSGESSLVLGEYDYQSLRLTFDEVATVWKAFWDDHPLYYWLSRTLTYGGKAVIQIDEEYANPYARAEVNDLIYTTAKAWREDASENAYLAALCYHDKILQAVDYAYEDNKKPSTQSWAHNIVGVFQEKGAVCEGYARTFQLLLNASGINNIYVTGTSSNAAHAWNLAQLDDGNWYWADLTYDDHATGIFRPNYFLVDENSNVNWRDYGSIVREFSFLENHTVANGTGVNYVPALPARATSPYRSRGELLLRDTFTVGKNTYAVEGHKTVRLTKSYETGDVVVPETVTYCGTEYTVVSLGGIKEGLYVDVFRVFGKNVNSVYLPKSVRFLSDYAMEGSIKEYRVSPENAFFSAVDGVLYTKSLYTLVKYPAASDRAAYVMPNETVQIAYSAFYMPLEETNPYLKSFTFGEGFQYDGIANWGYGWDDSHNSIAGGMSGIFKKFPNLETVIFAEDSDYAIEDGVVYENNGTILCAALSSIREVTVPAEVLTIGYGAFKECRQLTRVLFEENSQLREIKTAAFEYCAALQEITLPEGLEKLGDHAFTGCYAIGTNFKLPSSLKEIGGGVFHGSSVQSITFAGTAAEWDAVKKEKDWDVNNRIKISVQCSAE